MKALADPPSVDLAYVPGWTTDDDENLAVLQVLRRTQLTRNELYRHLPRTLRTQWSREHLQDVVLRRLIHEDLVATRQAGPATTYYQITQKAKALLPLT